MAKNTTDTLPHPDYGLTDETRRTILRDAEIFGVRSAAENHGVSRAVIYIWRKRLNWNGDTK